MSQEDNELGIMVLVIDCITKSIYLKFEEDLEISKWQHIIKAETVNTSPHLKDQQLSKDQVPVIVEKSVKFIYAHGIKLLRVLNIKKKLHIYFYILNRLLVRGCL